MFDRPDELILDRSPNDHLAFGGGGTHFCLGVHYDRIEIGEMMGQLLARSRTWSGPVPSWLASNSISGPTQGPIRLTPSGPVGTR